MITTVNGNLLNVKSGVIVHGCNAQGIMEGGVAWQIRNKWPHVYEQYGLHCKHGVRLGQVIYSVIETDLIVANAITQDKCDGSVPRQVDYEAVAQAMEAINEDLINGVIVGPVVFPMIGAGIGGGNWNIVSTIIDESISDDYQKVLFMYQP